MNGYLKSFLHRGLVFGGFGPIVVGTVYCILSEVLGISFSGREMLVAILSGYAIAFIQAGASVFNQIEEWSVAKSLLFHLGTLYLTYTFFYIVNSWIPFDPLFLVIFTAIFLTVYFVIWLSVYLSVRAFAKRLNQEKVE